jgi:hypothetical protein
MQCGFISMGIANYLGYDCSEFEDQKFDLVELVSKIWNEINNRHFAAGLALGGLGVFTFTFCSIPKLLLFGIFTSVLILKLTFEGTKKEEFSSDEAALSISFDSSSAEENFSAEEENGQPSGSDHYVSLEYSEIPSEGSFNDSNKFVQPKSFLRDA